MIQHRSKIMWNLEQALKLIKELEDSLSQFGVHCALAGSVLYRGTSENDLDLIIYPHKKKKDKSWNTYEVKKILKVFFKVPEIRDCGGVSQIRDAKEVSWIEIEDGKRIDFFFLK
jgi:hypothetical protein